MDSKDCNLGDALRSLGLEDRFIVGRDREIVLKRMDTGDVILLVGRQRKRMTALGRVKDARVTRWTIENDEREYAYLNLYHRRAHMHDTPFETTLMALGWIMSVHETVVAAVAWTGRAKGDT